MHLSRRRCHGAEDSSEIGDSATGSDGLDRAACCNQADCPSHAVDGVSMVPFAGPVLGPTAMVAAHPVGSMNSNRIGAVAGVFAVVALLARTVPGILLSRWVGGDPGQGPVPLVGSVGVTVSAYSSVVDIVGVTVPVALGVGLGVWISRQGESREAVRPALRAVAVGTVVAVLLVAAVPAAMWSTPVDTSGIGLFAIVVIQHLVSVSLLVTVGAFAGLALDRFEFGVDGDERPSAARERGTRPSEESGAGQDRETGSAP